MGSQLVQISVLGNVSDLRCSPCWEIRTFLFVSKATTSGWDIAPRFFAPFQSNNTDNNVGDHGSKHQVRFNLSNSYLTHYIGWRSRPTCYIDFYYTVWKNIHGETGRRVVSPQLCWGWQRAQLSKPKPLRGQQRRRQSTYFNILNLNLYFNHIFEAFIIEQ